MEMGLAICCSEFSNIEYDTSNRIGSDASRIGCDSQQRMYWILVPHNSLCFPSTQFSFTGTYDAVICIRKKSIKRFY